MPNFVYLAKLCLHRGFGVFVHGSKGLRFDTTLCGLGLWVTLYFSNLNEICLCYGGIKSNLRSLLAMSIDLRHVN